MISLKRRNYVRWLVSFLVARQSAKFHYKSNETSIPNKVTINLKAPWVADYDSDGFSMFDLFERLDREANAFGAALKTKNVLHLTYEDHVERDPREAYRLVCGFLDLPVRGTRIRYSRATPFSICELVTNYEELKDYVSGTKYEWMLNE